MAQRKRKAKAPKARNGTRTGRLTICFKQDELDWIKERAKPFETPSSWVRKYVLAEKYAQASGQVAAA